MPSVAESIRGGHEQAKPSISQPLEYSGSLDSFSYLDSTPVIGREYTGLQVVDILSSPECDRLIRDLAVTSTYPDICCIEKTDSTVSQRGVVFLRNQNVTPQQMREFMEKLTVISGCVSSPMP
jgi:hypothetical protein